MDFVNLGHNYWGTTDTAAIRQWIHDGHDRDLNDLYIAYLPLADGPVPTERATLGGLKAVFR